MCNCVSFISGYGISTVFAIICTRSGTNLGSTNPGMIIIAQETLDFWWAWFSHAYILLIPTFSLVCSPARVTSHLQPAHNAPLPLSAPRCTPRIDTNIRRINTNLRLIISCSFVLYSCTFVDYSAKHWTRIFGTKLSPNTLSARNHLTSELLRFL